ncbi:uncharacterized protein LOC119769624 [Culex quinquefasciatus]|uniref:uncharacterized protein LOC119769624 n=1 Tax=Culex quinquefasciatus TaxID=7176 RepID=UPI0018E367E2|nr:uncharacterized protein LOC119769624 [Culex quinquefasciatus]
MYADDLKMFRKVNNNVNCCALQSDINSLLNWCDLNGMKVHAKKCKVVSFSRSRDPLGFEYTVERRALDRVTSIKDPVVTVDRKMRSNEHIALTTAKTFAMLGFMKRNTAHFDDPILMQRLSVFELLRGNIDCDSIRGNVRFNEPARQGLRSERPLLWIPKHLFDYGYYNPLDQPTGTSQAAVIDQTQ